MQPRRLHHNALIENCGARVSRAHALTWPAKGRRIVIAFVVWIPSGWAAVCVNLRDLRANRAALRLCASALKRRIRAWLTVGMAGTDLCLSV